MEKLLNLIQLQLENFGNSLLDLGVKMLTIEIVAMLGFLFLIYMAIQTFNSINFDKFPMKEDTNEDEEEVSDKKGISDLWLIPIIPIAIIVIISISSIIKLNTEIGTKKLNQLEAYIDITNNPEKIKNYSDNSNSKFVYELKQFSNLDIKIKKEICTLISLYSNNDEYISEGEYLFIKTLFNNSIEQSYNTYLSIQKINKIEKIYSKSIETYSEVETKEPFLFDYLVEDKELKENIVWFTSMLLFLSLLYFSNLIFDSRISKKEYEKLGFFIRIKEIFISFILTFKELKTIAHLVYVSFICGILIYVGLIGIFNLFENKQHESSSVNFSSIDYPFTKHSMLVYLSTKDIKTLNNESLKEYYSELYLDKDNNHNHDKLIYNAQQFSKLSKNVKFEYIALYKGMMVDKKIQNFENTSLNLFLDNHFLNYSEYLNINKEKSIKNIEIECKKCSN